MRIITYIQGEMKISYVSIEGTNIWSMPSTDDLTGYIEEDTSAYSLRFYYNGKTKMLIDSKLK